jgi:hypothetical protein
MWDALLEMAGMMLACDCPIDQMCEADLLIGFDSQPLQRGTDGKWARTVVLLQGPKQFRSSPCQ